MGAWSPLAEADPVPGDPILIEELSRRLSGTGLDLREQAARLEGLNSADIWRGDAAEAFERIRAALPPSLRTVAERYERAARAVGDYAVELRYAQADARQALQRARDAEAAMDEGAMGMRAVQRQVELNAREADRWNTANPDLPSRQPAQVFSPDYSGMYAAGEDQLAAARRLLGDACDVRNTAAQRAAARVDDAARDELENTVLSWAGRGVRHAGTRVTELPGFDEVTTLASTVATAAGLAALALAWVPVIGQTLAVIAVGAGVIALAGNLAKLAAGTGSWGSVALDALSLATMGVGRAATVAARGSRAAAEASLRGTQAARSQQALWLSTTKEGRRLQHLNSLRAVPRGRLAEYRSLQAQYAGAGRGAARRAEGTAVSSAPARGFVPRRSDLREGFDPQRVWGDLATSVTSVTAAGALRSLPTWSAQSRGVLERGATRWLAPIPLAGTHAYRAHTFAMTSFAMDMAGAGAGSISERHRQAHQREQRIVARARQAGSTVRPKAPRQAAVACTP
jgi:uncharacterized protein YukE